MSLAMSRGDEVPVHDLERCDEVQWRHYWMDIVILGYFRHVTVYSWFRSMYLQFTNQSTDFRNFAIVRCPCAHDWVWLPMSPVVSSFVFRQEPVLTIDVWHTLHGDSVCWIWDLAFSDMFHQVWHLYSRVLASFWGNKAVTTHAYIPPVVISQMSLDFVTMLHWLPCLRDERSEWWPIRDGNVDSSL